MTPLTGHRLQKTKKTARIAINATGQLSFESLHIDLIQIHLIQSGFDSNCIFIILLKSAISNKTKFRPEPMALFGSRREPTDALQGFFSEGLEVHQVVPNVDADGLLGSLVQFVEGGEAGRPEP